MTKEEAKHIVDVAFSVPQAIRRAGENRTYFEDEIREAKGMAIKALEQEPCEDAITRIFKRMWNCRGKHTTSIDKVKMEQIIRDELPPVTSQPKTGKWMETDSADPYWYMCSECHRRLFEQEAFCPSCGAKMK